MDNNESWKFSIGINGIIVNRKIREGNIARKKLKEIADAREVIYPSYSPFIKKPVTLYKGSPSNPGRTNFFERLIKRITTFHLRIFSYIF
jgi:hypothetical protein